MNDVRPLATFIDFFRQSYNGDEGARTPNPRLAKAVLSQLSYVPECFRDSLWAIFLRQSFCCEVCDWSLLSTASIRSGKSRSTFMYGENKIEQSIAEKSIHKTVRAPRLELGTSTLSGWRSNQLSYARSRLVRTRPVQR